MKTYEGVNVSLPRQWMDVSGQLHALGACSPLERALGDWVGLKVDLDAVEKGKILHSR
jgi:hypothetical protein